MSSMQSEDKEIAVDQYDLMIFMSKEAQEEYEASPEYVKDFFARILANAINKTKQEICEEIREQACSG